MRVWIDITNSPHVLFFEPIIADLKNEGHEVTVTTRDYAQTIPLLDAKGIDYLLVGRHQGRSTLKKAWGLVSRSARLVWFGLTHRFDVAFGHNSNDVAVAARVLGIPQLLMFDYEHADLSHKLNCRMANSVMVPEFIPKDRITAHGAKPENVRHLPGLKEHVYLSRRTEGMREIRDDLGVDMDEVFCVVRPPATMSAYHRFENDLFVGLMRHLAETEGTRVLIVPRTAEQRAELQPLLPEQVMFAEKVYDGPALLQEADLVVSAGGTMNREAVVLGTPAYTIFAGRIGAVDEELIRRGLLTRVESPEDVAIRKREAGDEYWVENRQVVINELKRLAGEEVNL